MTIEKVYRVFVYVCNEDSTAITQERTREIGKTISRFIDTYHIWRDENRKYLLVETTLKNNNEKTVRELEESLEHLKGALRTKKVEVTWL